MADQCPEPLYLTEPVRPLEALEPPQPAGPPSPMEPSQRASPPQLPEQEDKTGTYMEIPFQEWQISNLIVPENYNPPISQVWDTVFRTNFPLHRKFKMGSGRDLPTFDSDHTMTCQVFNFPLGDWHFLFVKCIKRSRRMEISEDTWAEVAEEVTKHLRKSSSDLNRKYGIIVIGKSTRFYEVAGEELKDFEGDGNAYWLDRQCRTITNKLRWIRDNHVSHDLSGDRAGWEDRDYSAGWRGSDEENSECAGPDAADKESSKSAGPDEADEDSSESSEEADWLVALDRILHLS